MPVSQRNLEDLAFGPPNQRSLEDLAFADGNAVTPDFWGLNLAPETTAPEITEFTMDVTSTCCAQVIYDAASETLAIKFQKRGSYVYDNFPIDAYQDFANSGSKGQYFNENIRGQYEYQRIE